MIAANGTISYRDERGISIAADPLVGFGDDGCPLIVDDDGCAVAIPESVRYATVKIYQPPVPAAPGWYALLVYHSEGDSLRDCRAVVAWVPELGVYGSGDAIVIASQPFGQDDAPVGTITAALHCENAELVGYYHDDHQPPPPRAELDEIIAERREGYLEARARREARQAETAAMA
jgi:hypothetical protein